MKDGTITIDQLLRDMHGFLPSVDDALVRRAWECAKEAYTECPHWSGVPTRDHVLQVLQTLLQYQPDQESVIACLLHHMLQCGNWTLPQLEEEFGPTIRSLVGGVHLLSHVTLRDRRSSIEDLRLMLTTVSDDVRVIIITLCDRLAIMKTAGQMPRTEARRVAQDVLQLYAPVAARLGIYTLKHELEECAFPIFYPYDAERIGEQIHGVYTQYGSFLEQMEESLGSFFKERAIAVRLETREKQRFSIFRKMREKSLTQVLDVYDLFAIRVIVKSEAECYQVLGLLHGLGRPIPNRFKDYIAFPKPNGYQSLHTTLGSLPGAPDGVFVEVQVRTEKMHREAQFGIAAHWMYKEGASAMALAIDRAQLHRALVGQQALEEGEAREPTLADHIFVLTPRGDIVELPEGATPLDFAFQVHTDLGLTFRGARVNGSIVPLDYQLENGDIVEIQKGKQPQPSPQWMNLLKMASSRAKLKRFLYSQQRPQFIARGRDLVNEELRRHHLSPLDTDLTILRECDGEVLTMQQREDVLMKIGQGAERASSLFMRLTTLRSLVPQEERPVQQRPEAPVAPVRGKADIVFDDGVPMPTRYAKCCKPEEGAHGPIIGVVSRTGLVVVHQSSCHLLRNANPERKMGIRWREAVVTMQ